MKKRKAKVFQMILLLMAITALVFGGVGCDGGSSSGCDNPTPTPTPIPTPVPTPTATPIPTTTPTPVPTATPVPSGKYQVRYTMNQWSSGFQADVTIINNSAAAVNSWTLTWSFANGQQVTGSWNATVTQSGANVTASNPAGHWNGTIAANGGSVSFGFQGTLSGANSVPANFKLNGMDCKSGPVPTATPNPTATPRPTATPTPVPGAHVDNPYAGAKFYVNPEWSAKAAAEPGGRAVSNQSTGVWLDRIAAIEGTSSSQSNGPMGLRDHLDEALAQGGGAPIAAQFVIYNLPGRDCSALASNGELPATQEGLTRYKQEYIDPIAQIMADPKYRSVRIVTIIEIDSLPNLVTNLNVQTCATVNSNGYYVEGIRYALEKLHAIPNVYTYVDAAHHGWLGWDTNFGPTAELLRSTVAGTPDGLRSVDGFITNTANYSALAEPYIEVNQQTRQTKWVDWNYYVDELSFAQDFRQELINRGFPANIGMLIDTSRNGWGGPNRPTGPSNASDMNNYVNESRLDRRIHAGNWCNQSGAGLGERPQANPEPGIDAYVWIKPPGESDGSSAYISNEDGKGFDRMCDPTYTGNERNGNSMTGALPNAPISGAWFSAQFQELVRNAWPPLSGEIPGTTPTPVPTPIAPNTFVSQHSQLRLVGTQLSDQAGRPVQLKGMSSHWAAWYPQYINEGAIGWLVQNKGMTLFRIAMGIEPEGHYLEEPDYNKSLVFEAVDACIKLGIYVIIDWHDHNAHQHANEAEAFFQEMARMYGDTPNVLYEVFNEPEQVSYTSTVRPYAQRMVNAIRAIDPDNIILVSTPQWCQRPEDAAANPVNGSNIMYTLHFYAATHGQWLRDSADRAIAQGVPIFVSEWGASDATGGANGSLDLNAAQQWMDWMNARKLSWAAWNLADKEETTSILVPGARADGNWVDSDFKGHGPYVLRNMTQ